MVRKTAKLITVILLLINTYGCVALLAGTAGGTGTAVWLSGKLSQQVDAPYSKTIDAVNAALKSLRLEITKETIGKNIA
jgi:hypothetical protein